jgi:polyvinyl alcohol dehydrogenase (cytochrome)
MSKIALLPGNGGGGMGRWRGAAVVSVLALLGLAPGARSAAAPCDWPTYGHDLARTGSQVDGCTTIDPTDVATLVPAWVLHTDDSVTASPAVVDGTVYVGDWGGTFHAVDAATGAERWTYRIADDHAVAFGRIVSSAAVADIGGQRLILFGGGATLHALDTAGHLVAAIDLDPRTPADRAAQAGDPPTVEIESSPAVAPIDGRPTIFVGLDVHDRPHVGRTGLVALTLDRRPGGRWAFTPRWKYDVEAGRSYHGPGALTQGSGTGLGCGGVWSSPAVDPGSRLVTFGTASCSDPVGAEAGGWQSSEAMVALDAGTGALRWRFQPATTTADRLLDDDFGASPNLYRVDGRLVVGEGRKDATYHARDAATGAARFAALVGTAGNVQEDYAIGGFLGTTAVWSDGGRPRAVIGATAVPVPRSPGELDRATWAVRALDPSDGHVLWVHRLAGPSYGPTTVAGGVAFVPDTFTSTVQALDAATGRLLWISPVIGPPASGPAVVGDTVYLGAGVRETDAEFKSFGTRLQAVGNHPLSPLSGIYAFHLLPKG